MERSTNPGGDDGDTRRRSGFRPQRLVPVAVLLAGLGAFFGLGLDQQINFDLLRDNREQLAGWVSANLVLASLAYILAYGVFTAFSLPTGALMTLTGGFLFGTVLGGLYTVTGATLGATALFMVAKTTLGDFLRTKAGSVLERLEAGFQKNAFSYLLVLRLVPLFPFFVVNLAPAFLGVKPRTYILATFLGIIPATFVYSGVGAGLGVVFDQGGTPDLGIIFQPEIFLPLAGLAILALVPVAYRAVSSHREKDSSPDPLSE